jgi:hypothetical protein
MGSGGTASRSDPFTPPRYHFIGDLVGPRAGLDVVAKEKNVPAPAEDWTSVFHHVALSLY